MADVDLTIGIDATQLVAGADLAADALESLGSVTKTEAQKAADALDALEGKIGDTGRATQTLNRNMSAFQASGSTLQVAQGFSQTSKALGELNLSMAGFSAARTVLEFGRLGGELSMVGGRVGTLGAAIGRFTPHLLIVSTALSAGALAMELFGGETKKAATAWEELGESIAKARAQEQTAQFLGSSTEAAGRGRLAALEAAIAGTYGATGRDQLLDVEAFARSSGLSQIDVLRAIRGTHPRAQEYLETGGFTAGGNYRAVPRDQRGPVFGIETREIPEGRERGEFWRQQFPNEILGPEEQRELLRSIYDFQTKQLREMADQRNLGPVAPGSQGPGRADVPFRDPWLTQDYVSISAEQAAAVADEYEKRRKLEEEIAEIRQRAMDDLVRQAQQVGSYLGNAGYEFAAGLKSGREVLAAILSDLARAGFQRGGAEIAGYLASSFGSPSTTQTPGVSGFDYYGG